MRNWGITYYLYHLLPVLPITCITYVMPMYIISYCENWKEATSFSLSNTQKHKLLILTLNFIFCGGGDNTPDLILRKALAALQISPPPSTFNSWLHYCKFYDSKPMSCYFAISFINFICADLAVFLETSLETIQTFTTKDLKCNGCSLFFALVKRSCTQ